MLKKIKILLLFLIPCVVAYAVVKDRVHETPLKVREKVVPFLMELQKEGLSTNIFKIDSMITYKMYYFSILHVGNAKFSSIVGGPQNICTMTAGTKGTLVGRFMDAAASLETYFNQDTFLSSQYLEKTRIREKYKSKKITFGQNQRMIAIRDGETIQIPMDVYDPLGAFMHAVNLPYDDAQTHTIKLLSKDEIYELKATLIYMKDGLFKIKMEIAREDKSSSHGTTIYAWVTADKARVPIMLKSWSPVGYVSAILDKAELNRHSSFQPRR